MQQQSKLVLWRERFAEHLQSGLTVREYCRRHSFRSKSFYYWKRRVAQVDGLSDASAGSSPATSSAAWICVEPTPEASTCLRPSLVVRVSGAEIEVGAGFDPSLLRAVVDALRVQPC